jgi:hypothetical protein
VVAAEDFEGELAGAARTGDLFDHGQHLFTYPLPPVAGQHHHIVDIDQRLSGKG